MSQNLNNMVQSNRIHTGFTSNSTYELLEESIVIQSITPNLLVQKRDVRRLLAEFRGKESCRAEHFKGAVTSEPET